MAYPNNTFTILKFLTQENILAGVTVIDRQGIVTIDEWNSDYGVEPTEQEIIDAGNDLTTINGQVFSEWYAENGGDATLTLRKKASDLLDKVNDSEALLRALVLVMVDEINILRAEHSLADRTAVQVRTAIKNKLNSGDADG